MCWRGAFEADLMRAEARLQSSFGHHLTNQTLGQQRHVEFIANAMPFPGSKVIHRHHELQTFQIEFLVPPPGVRQAAWWC